MKDIVTPLIYNQEEYPSYGVHKKLGGIWSKKRGEWHPRKWAVGGNMKYPFCTIKENGKSKVMSFHIATHETLNSNLPVPEGITKTDWKKTPARVKAMLRKIWQVNHIDHDHLNFNPKNLEWTTGTENVAAYQRHRLAAKKG